MSQLYIRLLTGFYSHRKTVRLRARLGSDALWLPPRLWAYCAENQPDGDLSKFDPRELAILIGYEGDAISMVQALKDCGFMDLDGKVHDWGQHNGFHQRYSVRGKAAANARWAKLDQNATSNATSIENNACSMHTASSGPPLTPLMDKDKEREASIATGMLDASVGNGEEKVKSPHFLEAAKRLTATERISAEKALKRTEAELDKLKAHVAGGWKLDAAQMLRRAELREYRMELLDLLGMKA